MAQRAHITDVFTSAVSLLGDDKLEIRLGAITSLIRITNDYPDFAKSIIDLLQTYVREKPGDVGEIDPEIDIQMITSFLSERSRGVDSGVE